MDFFDRFELWTDRIVALLLVPFMLILGMAFIVIIHDLIAEVLSGITGNFYGMDFFVTFVSVVLFIGLVIGVFTFVKRGGPGLLR